MIGTFRYDDDRRLAEEWVQTDYRSFLTKLGVTTAESAAVDDVIVAELPVRLPRVVYRGAGSSTGYGASKSAEAETSCHAVASSSWRPE